MSDVSKSETPVLIDFREKMSRGVLPEWIVQHLDEYERDPEKGHLWDARPFGGHDKTPCLLLTTRGRKTGRLLTLPLIYGRDGDDVVIVGSKGGAAENPAWMNNLLANPNVGVQVVADRYLATARVSSGAERARLWEMMVGVYPPYRDYQSRTQREIPVVVLTRNR
jgi:deazaflavin-dependent oxidoreductase (nitroreductase family)